MSLNLASGVEKVLQKSFSTVVTVSSQHRIIQLMHAIPWDMMIAIIVPDLKKTAGRYWWLGRKLEVRIHLGAYFLQALFKLTDRQTEERIQDSPVWQFFCGLGNIPSFHVPDHTKIETFRNRISPDTQNQLNMMFIHVAQELGWTNLHSMDLDSTVQEANIAYPSDAHLLRKLALKAQSVWSFLKAKKNTLVKNIECNLKNISALSKAYFFRSKNTCTEKTRNMFQQLYKAVAQEVNPLLEVFEQLTTQELKKMPWNIRKALDQCVIHGKDYLKAVRFFIKNHTVKTGKILAFHAQSVACITKKKVGKPYEFGRVFQLGRLAGNLMISFSCTDITMNDKVVLSSIIREFQKHFGEGVLQELNTDKGYYSKKNVSFLQKQKICAKGVQRPVNIKNQPSGVDVEKRRCHRAGIEPLIGHVKSFGLRKSRMKSDKATLASGYRSVLGFNLHQFCRNFMKKTA